MSEGGGREKSMDACFHGRLFLDIEAVETPGEVAGELTPEGHVTRETMRALLARSRILSIRSGGAPTNVAEAFLAVAGDASVGLCGALGDDREGGRFIESLPPGLIPRVARIRDGATGLFLARAEERGSRIARYAAPGCAGSIDAGSIDASRVAYVDGYLLADGDAFERVLERCRALAGTIAFAVAHRALCRRFRERALEAISSADIAFMNEEELEELALLQGDSDDAGPKDGIARSPDDGATVAALERLAEKTGRRATLVATFGARGALARASDGEFFMARVERGNDMSEPCSGNPLKGGLEHRQRVERAGTGDRLAGAMLAALWLGEPLDRALSRAVRFASAFFHES